MKIKFRIAFIPAFLSILLLSQEWHDWAHVIASRIICGCWGNKAFDNWTICNSCSVSGRHQVLIWLAGPAATYLIIWLGWWLMRRKNSDQQKSFGFSLVFAAIPFVRILAAMAGGSDETYAFRLIFQHTDGSDRHIAALLGLLLILLMTIPALFRVFLLLSGWKEKLFLFAVFLVLPMYVERWILTTMNSLCSKGVLANPVLPGTPLLIVLWTGFLLIIFAISYKSILNFLEPSIQNRRPSRGR